MSKNLKTILKHAGVGFLVGFVGFWAILEFLSHANVSEGFGYLILMPAFIPGWLGWVFIDALHIDLKSVWSGFIMAAIGWGILAMICAEIILAIKKLFLFIKKLS